MGVSVGVLDHFNIRTRNLAETVRFYEDVLGLENGARPNFAFPGAWMYSEGRAVVHLVDISPTSEPQKPDSGVVHHVAFVSRGFEGMLKAVGRDQQNGRCETAHNRAGELALEKPRSRQASAPRRSPRAAGLNFGSASF